MSRGHVSDHRQLVHYTLMKFRYRKFFRPTSNQPGSFLCDDRRDKAGLLQQFDSHSVSSVELLPLIARLGIIHAGIGENSIHIRGEQSDFPQEASRRFLLSFQFHALIASGAGRPGKDWTAILTSLKAIAKGFTERRALVYWK